MAHQMKIGFCNKTVMFIAKNDTNNSFMFVSNRSDFGKNILGKFQIIGLEYSTLVLVCGESMYTRSLAIKKIFLGIPKFRMIGLFLSLFPRKISDIAYDVIAKHRKRFIKNKACEIPSSDVRKKFIL